MIDEARPGALRLWLVIAALVVLRFLAPLAPGMWLWGINALGFLPWWGWAITGFASLTLIPPLARAATGMMEAGSRWLEPPAAGFWVAIAAAGVLVFLLPDRIYFVGDFLIRQGSAELDAPPALLYPQYLPLDLWLHFEVPTWLKDQFGLDPNLTNRTVGAIEATLLAAAGFALARALGLTGLAALVAGAALFWGGWLSLYTGLAKGFSELVLATAVIGTAAFWVLRHGRGRLVLSVALCVALLFHRSALALVPAAFLALAIGEDQPETRQTGKKGRRRKRGGNTALEILVWLLPLLTLAFLVPRIVSIFGQVDLANFGLTAPPGAERESLFSLLRLLDHANLILMLIPLAPVVLVLLFDCPTRRAIRGREWAFLAALTAPFILMAFLYRPPQGLFRDYDGLAGCGMALAVLLAVQLGLWVRLAEGKRWLAVAMIATTAVPVLLWLAVHTQLEWGLARVEGLADGPPVRKTEVRVHTLDFLAARLERQEDYAGSARVLSRAVELAPSPRLIAGWAQTASKAGDWEQAERAYALLLERAPEDLTRFRLLAYMGLASAAGRRGDLPSARHYLERALALNPNHREALRLLRQVEIEEQARQ
jgi:hypothetical protein